MSFLAMLKGLFESERDRPIAPSPPSHSPFSIKLLGGEWQECAAAVAIPNRMISPHPAGGLLLDCDVKLKLREQFRGPFEVHLFVGEHKLIRLRINELPDRLGDGDALCLSGKVSLTPGELR